MQLNVIVAQNIYNYLIIIHEKFTKAILNGDARLYGCCPVLL